MVFIIIPICIEGHSPVDVGGVEQQVQVLRCAKIVEVVVIAEQVEAFATLVRGPVLLQQTGLSRMRKTVAAGRCARISSTLLLNLFLHLLEDAARARAAQLVTFAKIIEL
jgi:hypothetical protein